MGYFVDIPTVETISSDEGAWTNLGTFSSKAEAVEWIRANIGWCDDDGNICLLTMADAGETKTVDVD